MQVISLAFRLALFDFSFTDLLQLLEELILRTDFSLTSLSWFYIAGLYSHSYRKR